MLFEFGITLFAKNLLFAVVEEACNGRPGSFSMSLPSLRVQLLSPRKLAAVCQNLTVFVQVVASHASVIHPVPKTGIADKVSCPNGFIQSLELFSFTLQFRLKNQHIYSKVLGVTSTFYNKGSPKSGILKANKFAREHPTFAKTFKDGKMKE